RPRKSAPTWLSLAVIVVLVTSSVLVIGSKVVFAQQPPQVKLSGHPQGAALDFANHDLYIANNNGYVLVFDPSTNAIVANITTHGTLRYIAYDNATGHLYATNNTGVVIIDGVTNSVMGKVSTPNFYPYGVTPGNGEVFVTGSTSLGGSEVKVINTQTETVTANITVPSSYPAFVAYDSKDNRLYVADYFQGGGYGNQTSVVDLSTNKVVANITVPNGPFAVAYGFGKVYVSEAIASTVAVIDPATNKVVANLSVGYAPDGIAFSGDPLIGVSSYGTGGIGVTSFVDPFTDELVGIFTTPNGPQLIIYDHLLMEFFVVEYDGYIQGYEQSEIGNSSTTTTTTSPQSSTTSSTTSTTSTSSTTTTTTTSTTASPSSSPTTSTEVTSVTSSSSVSTASSTSSQSTTSEGGGGLGIFDYLGIGVVLLLALLFGWLFYSGNLPWGKKPPDQPPMVPPVVAVAAKKELKTVFTYEASMHSDATGHTGGAGHAWGDLRVTKTVTEDGKVISTEVTEYTYDFAPAGANVFYTDGEVVASKRTTTGGDGGGLSGEGNIYISITEEGFNAAKTWAESTVTKDGGRTRKPPGTPPGYRVLWYNCVDFTIEICKRAGVDVSSFTTWGPSTPSNLVAKIRQKNCKHEWEETIIYHMGTGDGMCPPPTKIWVCKLCGLTKPAGGG
ncbi:MAG TPA: YncE family protein, partial [Nitrososphaerales archaeon]|nr:YncE family protein [Nitrososphaerales archaeon]